jgi:hypothetical protein
MLLRRALDQRAAERSRNRRDIADREADDEVVSAVLQNAAHPESGFTDPFEKAVADRFVALLDTTSADANIEDL